MRLNKYVTPIWATSTLVMSVVAAASYGGNNAYGAGYNYNPQAVDWQQQQSQEYQEPRDAPHSERLPPQLPPGWEEYVDPSSGLPYYYNTADGTTTWDRPILESQESVEPSEIDLAEKLSEPPEEEIALVAEESAERTEESRHLGQQDRFPEQVVQESEESLRRQESEAAPESSWDGKPTWEQSMGQEGQADSGVFDQGWQPTEQERVEQKVGVWGVGDAQQQDLPRSEPPQQANYPERQVPEQRQEPKAGGYPAAEIHHRRQEQQRPPAFWQRPAEERPENVDGSWREQAQSGTQGTPVHQHEPERQEHVSGTGEKALPQMTRQPWQSEQVKPEHPLPSRDDGPLPVTHAQTEDSKQQPRGFWGQKPPQPQVDAQNPQLQRAPPQQQQVQQQHVAGQQSAPTLTQPPFQRMQPQQQAQHQQQSFQHQQHHPEGQQSMSGQQQRPPFQRAVPQEPQVQQPAGLKQVLGQQQPPLTQTAPLEVERKDVPQHLEGQQQRQPFQRTPPPEQQRDTMQARQYPLPESTYGPPYGAGQQPQQPGGQYAGYEKRYPPQQYPHPGQYNQYGQYGQQHPQQQSHQQPYGQQYQGAQQGAYQTGQGSNQLVPHATEAQSVVREALGSAWQGILGFRNRTKEVVESATSTVTSKAKEASQTITSTSATLWDQAKNSIGAVFEGGTEQQSSQYSLTGRYGTGVSTSSQPPPGYGQQGSQQQQGVYPGQRPPPGYASRQGPPGYAGQQATQGYPPQQVRYPPGYGPPQPRTDLAYPHQQQQGPLQGQPPPQGQPPMQGQPPLQSQWGRGPPVNQYPPQQRMDPRVGGSQYPPQPRNQGPPPQQQRQPPTGDEQRERAPDPWQHPALGPDGY